MLQVDENLTPWLLEVNRCPSLSYDCEVDRLVKKPMLHHLFDLLSVPRVSQPIERALNVPILIKRNKSCGRIPSPSSFDAENLHEKRKKKKHSPGQTETYHTSRELKKDTETNQFDNDKALKKIFSSININEILYCNKCSLPYEETKDKVEDRSINNNYLLNKSPSFRSPKNSSTESIVDSTDEALSWPNSNLEKENEDMSSSKRKFLCKDCKKKLRDGFKRRNSADMISTNSTPISYLLVIITVGRNSCRQMKLKNIAEKLKLVFIMLKQIVVFLYVAMVGILIVLLKNV